MSKPATEEQIEYLLNLTRKANLYYRTRPGRRALIIALWEKEKIDIDNLTHEQAQLLINSFESRFRHYCNSRGIRHEAFS